MCFPAYSCARCDHCERSFLRNSSMTRLTSTFGKKIINPRHENSGDVICRDKTFYFTLHYVFMTKAQRNVLMGFDCFYRIIHHRPELFRAFFRCLLEQTFCSWNLSLFAKCESGSSNLQLYCFLFIWFREVNADNMFLQFRTCPHKCIFYHAGHHALFQLYISLFNNPNLRDNNWSVLGTSVAINYRPQGVPPPS